MLSFEALFLYSSASRTTSVYFYIHLFTDQLNR